MVLEHGTTGYSTEKRSSLKIQTWRVKVTEVVGGGQKVGAEGWNVNHISWEHTSLGMTGGFRAMVIRPY